MSEIDALSYIESAAPRQSAEEAFIHSLLEHELLASSHQETASDRADRVERLRALLLPPASGGTLHFSERSGLLDVQDSERFLEELCARSPLIKQELEARNSEDFLPQKFDLSRYQSLERLESDASTPDMVRRLQLAQEYTALRLANLELMANTSVGGMRAFLHAKKGAQGVGAWLSKKVQEAVDEAEGVNQKRKIGQLKCGNAMAEKRRVGERYARENRELEDVGLIEKRQEVDRLKRIAKRRKIGGEIEENEGKS